MKRIRIGKDINVLWTVDVEGLSSMELYNPTVKLYSGSICKK